MWWTFRKHFKQNTQAPSIPPTKSAYLSRFLQTSASVQVHISYLNYDITITWELLIGLPASTLLAVEIANMQIGSQRQA